MKVFELLEALTEGSLGARRAMRKFSADYKKGDFLGATKKLYAWKKKKYDVRSAKDPEFNTKNRDRMAREFSSGWKNRGGK